MAPNDDANKESGRDTSPPSDHPSTQNKTSGTVPQTEPVTPVDSTTAGVADRFDGLNLQDVNALLAVIKAQAQPKK